MKNNKFFSGGIVKPSKDTDLVPCIVGDGELVLYEDLHYKLGVLMGLSDSEIKKRWDLIPRYDLD